MSQLNATNNQSITSFLRIKENQVNDHITKPVFDQILSKISGSAKKPEPRETELWYSCLSRKGKPRYRQLLKELEMLTKTWGCWISQGSMEVVMCFITAKGHIYVSTRLGGSGDGLGGQG